MKTTKFLTSTILVSAVMLIISAFITLSVSSCTKSSAVEPVIIEDVSLTATVTKGSFNNDSLKWNEDDFVKVFYEPFGNLEYDSLRVANFSIINSEESDDFSITEKFAGKILQWSKPINMYFFYPVNSWGAIESASSAVNRSNDYYNPYSRIYENEKLYLSVNVAKNQFQNYDDEIKLDTTSIDNYNFRYCQKTNLRTYEANGIKVRLNSLMARFDVNVTNATTDDLFVKKIVVRSYNGKNIFHAFARVQATTGEVTYPVRDAHEFTISSTKNKSSNINISLPSNETLYESNKIMMFPTSFNQKYVIDVYTEDNESNAAVFSFVKNTEKYTINLSAGKVYSESVQLKPKNLSYLDEFGANYGPGILYKGYVWAPVNCGYEPVNDTYKGYPYGKLYQWGNIFGLGYKDDGGIYEDAIVAILVDGYPSLPADPALENTYYKGWEETKGIENSWGGVDGVDKTESDPCPYGWRVPTKEELQVFSVTVINKFEKFYHGSSEIFGMHFQEDANDDINGNISLPAAGTINNNGYIFINRGSLGYYWCSTKNVGTDYYNLVFTSVSTAILPEITTNNMGNAFSIRCIKDDYTE
ncbi:MAG: FISUMP domain-containing protein [Bacteroidales bacterium]